MEDVPDNEAGGIKRRIKLTMKALLAKVNDLQTMRKSKLTKAATLKNMIQSLMSERGYENEINKNFSVYQVLIDDARCVHNKLIELLPVEEKEKNEIWFKAKLLSVNEFKESVAKYQLSVAAKMVGNPDEEIKPTDSVSNVETIKSNRSRSSKSSLSSISVVQAKAEAKRAALLARASAMEGQHAMEEEAESLCKRLEKSKLEAEIEAAGAELAVLRAFAENAEKDGMESYFEKERIQLPGKRQAPVVSMETEHLPAIRRERERPDARHTISAPTQPLHVAMEQRHEAGNTPATNSTFQILQRQNEISELLIKQQNASQLPPREILVFDGDPLKFNLFMHAFKHCVEDKSTSKGDCMYYLERYTRGRPRDLVQSCLHMSPERGFETAKALLKEHFGDETKVTAAYIDKIHQWPIIRAESVSSLQDYAMFLRGCNNAMHDLQDMRELDMSANLKLVLSKLPFKLRERFRLVAYDIRENQHRRPCFNDVVRFLEHQVKLLSDPVFGELNPPERATHIKKDEVY